MLTKWLGGIEAAVALGGIAALLSGMYLLANKPLVGVMIIIASMAMLMSGLGKVCELQETRQDCNRRRGDLSRDRASNSGK